MSEIVDVAVIGAGPYGLSLGAHLAGLGIDFRIFGSPMHTWRTSMPKGMVLKSEGNASDLYDPKGELTLRRFCEERGYPYQDIGLPIPLATFIEYGTAFQSRFVPNLEDRLVTAVMPTRYGFDVHLEDGEVAPARRVIVAAGIRAYEYMPPQLADLPIELASHTAIHVTVDQFIDRDIAVIGGGASAINIAALLHQRGARPTIICRRPKVDYCGPPAPRSLWDRLKEPENGLGTGWRSWACCAMPDVFHAMPEAFRVMVVRKHLPAAPGWTLRAQVDGIVPTIGGARLASADTVGGRVKLRLETADGIRDLVTDHVIAGTGYRVDMRRLAFFGPSILDRLDCVEHTPRLSRNFESSIPGLHFVGTAAANSFGPMLRFAYGAGFASRRVSAHLARSLVRDRTVVGAGGARWSKPANLART
ncbi:MAG: NAD(P)-binding domain-containing protein [Rhodospirillales bacterium]|nr:NAD(P)-binding domain-containing protein [Rhodospirillales bacterium]